MSIPALALLVSAALYTGFQWTIRSLVYPQFARVGHDYFARYEAEHQRRVSWTVAPLFAALLISSAAVVWDPPAGAPWPAVAGEAALAAVILGVTGLLAVPLHGRLAAGFDAAVHRRLLAVDTVRLVAAGLDVLLAVVLVLG